MNTPFTIVFMGTPDFAVPPLKALAAAGHHIPLVITQPDRRKGRGRKLAAPPVKEAAGKLGLKVLQPATMKDPDIMAAIKTAAPDFLVVVAFGHKLSREILDIPRIYPINIHASLLPAWRGSSPIQAAIRNRDKTTGVTTMVMDTGLDTGDMLLKAEIPLTENETAQTLHDRLAPLGADLIIDTLEAIAENRMTPIPQDHSRATLAPMLKKSDGCVDWAMTAQEIHAHVRAMTPWPGAYGFLGDRRIKILEVSVLDIATDAPPGTIFFCDCSRIHVATGTGAVAIERLQGASGKCLCSEEFLRGNALSTGECFADFED